jgi:hypothetical protein
LSFAKDFGLILAGTLNATWPRQARHYRQQILRCQRFVRNYLACTRAREIALGLLWEREALIIEASKCNREVQEWMEARAKSNVPPPAVVATYLAHVREVNGQRPKRSDDVYVWMACALVSRGSRAQLSLAIHVLQYEEIPQVVSRCCIRLQRGCADVK